MADNETPSRDADLTSSAKTRGLFYGCLVALMFASFIIMSRAGLGRALSISDLAALRFVISAIVLSPFLLRRRSKQLGALQASSLAIFGGLGFALLAYAGFSLAPSSHGGALIHGTLGLTTSLLLLSLGIPQKGRALSLVVISAGAAAMALDGGVSSSVSTLMGDAFLLAASFCWSAFGIYVSRLRISAIEAAANVTAISALTFLPVYLLIPGKMIFEASWTDILIQAVFQGLFIGAASVFVYTRAVTLLGPERVALFAASVPAMSLVGGYLFLSERPGPAAILGVGLVTCGMILALKKQLFDGRAEQP